MSQTKAQLIQPIGVVTASGIVVSGVVTASSFDGDVVGSATSIISGSNLNVGIISATTFSGDFTGNATGINTGADIKVGSFTATSFTGDFTGTATSMKRGTGSKAGAVNATGFHVSGTSVGDVTGDVTGNIDGNLIGNLTGNVTGNVTGDVTGVSTGNVTGNVTGNLTGNLVGAAGSVASGANIHAGVVTATTLSGDGSALTGIAATNFNTQVVTANSAETIIDLSDGNCITMNQSANTTVGFASTSTAMDITIIRIKDETATARTITWPSSIQWDGGSAPNLISNTVSGDKQQFQFITRDSGLTWYGWEPFKNDVIAGQFWAWGYNEVGQLANNNKTTNSSPIQIGTNTNWSDICKGNGGYNVENRADTMAIKADGTMWAWGTNQYGRLGQNNTVSISSPIQIPGEWATGSFNWKSNYGVKTDGTAWAWGLSENGELGLNQSTPANAGFSSPIQLPGAWSTDPDKFSAQGKKVFAIKADGTLWSWGAQNRGVLGQNMFVQNEKQSSSPAQVGTDTDWAKIARGGMSAEYYGTDHVHYIKTDGTLWACGNEEKGILGMNSINVNRSSPVQVGTDTNWNRVSYGTGRQVFALKTDGTMWGWGSSGGQGQMGWNSTTQNRSSPTQIGTDTTWCPLCGGSVSLASKTDGTLWVWGSMQYGGLGLNSPSNSHISSPTQIPGSNWGGKDRDVAQCHIYSSTGNSGYVLRDAT